MNLAIVIMAAGKGMRMQSSRPKVLHTLAGMPLLGHVMQASATLQAPHTIVITGHGADEVESYVNAQHPQVRCVRQIPQQGTGHAVQQAVPALPDEGVTLILNGDVPLVRGDTVAALLQACQGQHLALLTLELGDATGYGRIVRRADGCIQGIVEHKDTSVEQRRIREVYTGVMAAPTRWLKQAVMGLNNHNAQGEYYLTDVVARAVADGLSVVGLQATDEIEVLGVNSPAQLADLERRYQARQAWALMEAGVRLRDPARLDIRGQLSCEPDVEIDINCIFEGRVHLGQGVRVSAHCFIRDAVIEAGAVIYPYTHIDGQGEPVRVGQRTLVGPYARLRSGADLGAEVHIGNFVEVKNSHLDDGAKANHLAYLGDSTIGKRVNFGAGGITANFDGAHKHRTVIEDDAHVGSNCVLVAPVTVGAGATIGAGSTIGKDAPAGQLTVARAKQVSLPAWTRPSKSKSKLRP
ncbi:MAG: UDP-N-acetylglucosamine diphosphorylase/glucosamine-1-phosphate N-acetyltransferase [Betaproteobacteria bacterium]|nr:UDP-N-acetylglucosamine diphosphorylase/glucosamine-1-phosphate N-acetyltransferase [Betaproteobacteria bacterium]